MAHTRCAEALIIAPAASADASSNDAAGAAVDGCSNANRLAHSNIITNMDPGASGVDGSCDGADEVASSNDVGEDNVGRGESNSSNVLPDAKRLKTSAQDATAGIISPTALGCMSVGIGQPQELYGARYLLCVTGMNY
jgi:hypothetical protein